MPEEQFVATPIPTASRIDGASSHDARTAQLFIHDESLHDRACAWLEATEDCGENFGFE